MRQLPRFPVHLSFPVLFGAGGISYISKEDSRNNNLIEDSEDLFPLTPFSQERRGKILIFYDLSPSPLGDGFRERQKELTQFVPIYRERFTEKYRVTQRFILPQMQLHPHRAIFYTPLYSGWLALAYSKDYLGHQL